MPPSSLSAATAISMKPACDTDEYASSRFTFRCTSAARFPTASETHASTAIAIVQRCSCSGKADDEDPQRQDERSHLRRGGHERGHRGRRALVDVRRPHVERRRRGLEPEAGDQHRQPGQRAARRLAALAAAIAPKPSSPVAP